MAAWGLKKSVKRDDFGGARRALSDLEPSSDGLRPLLGLGPPHVLKKLSTPWSNVKAGPSLPLPLVPVDGAGSREFCDAVMLFP